MIIFWWWESFSYNIHLHTVCLGMEIFILWPEMTVLRICKTGVENGTLANDVEIFFLSQCVKYGIWGGFRPSHIIQRRNLCAVRVMCSICHGHNVLPPVCC